MYTCVHAGTAIVAYHDKEGDIAALIACCLFLNLVQQAVAIIVSSTERLSAFSLTTKVGREDIQMVVTPAATQTTGSCQLPKRMSINSFRQGKSLQSSQPLCGGESQSIFIF